MDPRVRNIFADTFVRLAATADNQAEGLADLTAALKIKPDDEELAQMVAALTKHLAQGPAYVAIERARTIGPVGEAIEGRLYLREPDGRLKPVDGHELARAEEIYPGFAKNWRLTKD